MSKPLIKWVITTNKAELLDECDSRFMVATLIHEQTRASNEKYKFTVMEVCHEDEFRKRLKRAFKAAGASPKNIRQLDT